MKRQLIEFVLGVAGVFTLAMPSYASTISFNFDSLADGASNTSVKNYMQTIVGAAHPGGTVNVTGSQGEKNYTGDDHAVGPISGSTVKSETLGTSNGGVHHNGALDAFIINNGSTTIGITFSFPIYLTSFDYEIFPDGTCTTPSCAAANWPDFTFEANDVQQFHTLGITPGTSGTYAHSPNSGSVHNEHAPQYLGVSGNRFFTGGVTKLEFIDWPRTIGIDNLLIGDNLCDIPDQCLPPPPPPPVIPEPTSFLLLGGGLFAGLGFRSPRKRA